MSTRPTTSSVAFFGHLSWIIVGPMFLMVLALSIARRNTGWLTLLDLCFRLILGGMLLGRWLEFRSGTAVTGIGGPAMPADLRRYLVVATLVGLGLRVLREPRGQPLARRVGSPSGRGRLNLTDRISGHGNRPAWNT